MNILHYSDLNYNKVKKQFAKIVSFLENNDFASAEVKKMQNNGFYRAKLDYENRLLFKFAKYNNSTYILLLEVIYNHEYEKSRFLRGAKIDESKLITINNTKDIEVDEVPQLNYINVKNNKFHLLNKIISFDDAQQKILKTKPPLIIIGSAGSGKTALTLEKMKSLKGDVLYVTLSQFLVEHSSKLYYSDNYNNKNQEVDFLSFKEYLESTKIIKGKELDYKAFNSWLDIRKFTFGIKDTYKLFEEFKGVLSGLDITKEYLTKNEYLNLGVKQSIYLKPERENVYNVFEKYLELIKNDGYYDINIIAHQWLNLIEKKYDFIVIDEVQDFTNIQLYSILKSLKDEANFILCGDSNQIVHPNFFSWTHVKTMFHEHAAIDSQIKILQTNYRNSIEITNIANKLLNIKNTRFGSIDKESTYLIESIEDNNGEVNFYNYTPKIGDNLNAKTVKSTKFAVVVMSDFDKIQARKIFKTPLLFSIHEAKGLEYDNIILVDFISNNSKAFNEITQGLNFKDVDKEEVTYSRAKDKTDKSLDAYKFYINSLYVGITRAVKNLYIVESSKKHDILKLLNLVETTNVNIKQQQSSIEEWKKEARKLELQGKKEQSDEIKKTILGIATPDWEPITTANLEELKTKALDPINFNKKAKDKLFAYALLYNDTKVFEQLVKLKYNKAKDPEKEINSLNRKYYPEYNTNNLKAVQAKINKYGLEFRDEFNLTPLLCSLFSNNTEILNFLLNLGAKTDVIDNVGRNPFRLIINKIFHSPNTANYYNSIIAKTITDNIKIKVGDKLIKIPNRKMEYFLLNFMMTLQDAIIYKYKIENEYDGIKAGDIVNEISNYPDNLLEDYRKKRTYISSMLSKNEIESNNPYNHKLFVRVERGVYVVNPDLSVLHNDKWIPIYDFSIITETKNLTPEQKQLINNERVIKEIKENLDNYIPEYKEEIEQLLKRYEKDTSINILYEQYKIYNKFTNQSGY
ncbi:MAG: UvrD-helicase domain-containing protein [Salinivirgaceae bacterium]|jgi:hypothetical protein|nr:UvrD-helicase domain-containing protein [Salinivirgaceae bacterium]